MAEGAEGAEARLARAEPAIEKYVWLRDLRERDEREFFALLMRRTETVLPFVYTPTVGEACQKYSRLPLKTQGLYLSLADKGHLLERLQAWPRQGVRVVVATDGERILGLGDLGSGGMGISEGKILLYTAAAGVPPSLCLPICLDVGTNNEDLLKDPEYKGLRQRRPAEAEYSAFMDEFMSALRAWAPHVLLQFEDFGNHNAFRLLNEYRGRQCCFNDDIQGTACICLAGILSGLRLTGRRLADETILFLGAGEAGVGIGELIALALHRWEGLSIEEARRKCIFLDSKGVVCAGRPGKLQAHKTAFAHDIPHHSDLLSAVEEFKPGVLIGVSTIAGAFNQAVVEKMAELNERPLIFPLSNPTSKSECTFEQAMQWTKGRVVFASGSPFDPVEGPDGRMRYPAQANNAYIFPAVGHAAVLCQAPAVTEEVFLRAAKALAELSPQADLEAGRLFPPFSGILDVSRRLMCSLAQHMCDSGLTQKPEGLEGDDWDRFFRDRMYVAEGRRSSL